MSDKEIKERLENVEGFAMALREQIAQAMVMADSIRRLLEPLGVSKEMFDKTHAAVTAEYEAIHQKGLSKAIQTEEDERLRKALKDLPGKKQ